MTDKTDELDDCRICGDDPCPCLTKEVKDLRTRIAEQDKVIGEFDAVTAMWSKELQDKDKVIEELREALGPFAEANKGLQGYSRDGMVMKVPHPDHKPVITFDWPIDEAMMKRHKLWGSDFEKAEQALLTKESDNG